MGMTFTIVGPVECEWASRSLPRATYIKHPWNLGSDVRILDNGKPIIVGTYAIYGPDHNDACILDMDFRNTIKARKESN